MQRAATPAPDAETPPTADSQPRAQADPVPRPDADEALPSGRRVIFLLFLLLWIATLVSLLWFASIAERQYPGMTNRVYYALAADLALPIVAWFIFKWMPRNRHMRT